LTDRERELLARLAELCGLLPGYHDIWGQYHAADAESLQAVLRALGAEVDGAEALEREIRERERARR